MSMKSVRYLAPLFVACATGSAGEPWITDGTMARTMLLADIAPDSSSSPDEFTVHDGLLFFAARNSALGEELWKTDGTPEGSYLLLDTYAGPLNGYPRGLSSTGGVMVFTAVFPEDGQLPRRYAGEDSLCGKHLHLRHVCSA
ncbi:MAG: ELWxxDGT repeat protein [Myxococcota bacterium]|jgi:ELWxxDGT repeat protein